MQKRSRDDQDPVAQTLLREDNGSPSSVTSTPPQKKKCVGFITPEQGVKQSASILNAPVPRVSRLSQRIMDLSKKERPNRVAPLQRVKPAMQTKDIPMNKQRGRGGVSHVKFPLPASLKALHEGSETLTVSYRDPSFPTSLPRTFEIRFGNFNYRDPLRNAKAMIRLWTKFGWKDLLQYADNNFAYSFLKLHKNNPTPSYIIRSCAVWIHMNAQYYCC